MRFLFSKKKQEFDKEVVLRVLRRELEMFKEIDELSQRKIEERREKVTANRYIIKQKEKDPLIRNGLSKNAQIKDYRNGRYFSLSCSA